MELVSLPVPMAEMRPKSTGLTPRLEVGNSKLIATESNGYFHVDNWVRVGSASGIFVDETNARHFYAPTSDKFMGGKVKHNIVLRYEIPTI